MILLTAEEILLLHQKLLLATGGREGLRDRGLLESAVHAMNAGFDNVERYPTAEEKAARLAFSLICNHAFVDGNKRVGILAMLMMLALNDKPLTYTQAELIKLGLSIASGAAETDAIHAWIMAHRSR